jgi:hypothetical protein
MVVVDISAIVVVTVSAAASLAAAALGWDRLEAEPMLCKTACKVRYAFAPAKLKTKRRIGCSGLLSM